MRAENMHGHESRGRGVYPRAGVEGLMRLNELDGFRVTDGEPDIRGWDVVGAKGTTVGEVHDLLVDTTAMKVRYLDVELHSGASDISENPHVLVPIGAAQLHDDDDRVRLPRLTGAQLLSLRPYGHGMLDRDQERELLDQYVRLGASEVATLPARDEDLYGHEYFDERQICRTQRDRGTDARYLRRRAS